jgi:FKBP-type peptidyl-prolyl cis-trans isomerase
VARRLKNFAAAFSRGILTGVKTPLPRMFPILVAAAALAVATAMSAQTPGAAPKSAAGFPTSAYAELGSSMGQASHFGEIGWTDEQFGAFIDGMRAAFAGKPFEMDDTGHRLSAEMGRRIDGIDAGAKGPFTGDFPLSAYSAFGSSVGLGGHFGEVGWTQDQFDAFAEGMRSAFKGTPYEVEDSARQLAADMGRRIKAIEAGTPTQQAAPPFDPSKLVQYMKDASARYHLQLSESGLGYSVTPGRNGIRPRLGDTVVISCNAVAFDGVTKLPQLSSGRIHSKVEQMFPGFREGLQMMTVDSHAIFVLPPALSFGHGAWPEGVTQGSPIIFEVTLLDVVPAPAPKP